MKWRRSPAEIRFRAAQEIWNLKSFSRPPEPTRSIDSFARLFPTPQSLCNVLDTVPEYREQLLVQAQQIADGRVPHLFVVDARGGAQSISQWQQRGRHD